MALFRETCFVLMMFGPLLVSGQSRPITVSMFSRKFFSDNRLLTVSCEVYKDTLTNATCPVRNTDRLVITLSSNISHELSQIGTVLCDYESYVDCKVTFRHSSVLSCGCCNLNSNGTKYSVGVDFIAKQAVHAKKYILCRPECFSEENKYNIYTDLRQSSNPIIFTARG